MSKVRVYELARELNIETKMLVTRIKGLGIDISSHQSSLSDEQIDKIRSELKGGGSSSAAKATAAAQPAANSPTKVIRRRRAEAETPSVEAADAVAEAPAPESVETPSVSSPAVAARTAMPTDDLVSEPKHESRPSASSDDAAPARDTIRRDGGATIDRGPRREAYTPGARPSSGYNRPPEEGGAERRPSPQQQGSRGATIVRRATPEEMERQQERKQERERQPYRPNTPSGDRRPHGGSGGGYRSSGPSGGTSSQQGGPRRSYDEDRGMRSVRSENFMQPQTPPPMEAPGSGREREIDKTRDRRPSTAATTETDEAIAKRLLQQKQQKRSHLNTRALLDALSVGEEEDVSAVIEDPKLLRRTVYTPDAGRKKDARRRKDLKKTQITTPRAAYRVVKMGGEITVGELGKQLGVKSSEIIKKLMSQGVMATINQTVDFDTATLMASEYGFEVQSNVVNIDDILKKSKTYQDALAKTPHNVERPPIVTVMGHVDHGKTSILDAIRQANVAKGEAGGITQHIGAYTVERDGKVISFLDTPGHEAFSAMRSRGAEVTDIVVLVVAADDGVMPQTKEAISHAKAAGVPLIVAINKIDKPNSNLDRIYTELMEHGIQAEDWGGETQFVKVSALQRIGIDELLDNILILAEVLDLKANPKMPMAGVVVEAHLDKGRGPVATVMVKDGTLRVGDYVVAGSTYGKVRLMNDHNGQRMETAGPSIPVEVIGLADVPMAGDKVNFVDDERMASELIENRKRAASGGPVKSSASTLEQLLSRVQDQETPEVPLILKADTQGSIEAIAETLTKLNTDKVKTKIIHKAVGGITESDIMLSKTAGAVILGFNVRAGRGLDDAAEKQGVTIQYFSVIYDIVNNVKALMSGKLPPILTEVIQGHAEVRQTIKVPKIGLIAGTAVTDGKITRTSQLRLIRDSVVIFDGKISSLRRFKDDVKEVAHGYECGIGIEGYQDIRIGDVIESYTIHQEAATI